METMEELVIRHSKKKLNGTWAGIEMLGINDMEEAKKKLNCQPLHSSVDYHQKPERTT